MEKRNYVKPILNSEAFVPQTYVAACAEEPGYVIYSFECSAGEKYKEYNVYVNGTDITGRKAYHPCNDKHEVKVPEGTPITDVFEIGYMDDINTNRNENTAVYVWRGPNKDNCHCMINPGTEHIVVPKQMS